MFSPVVRTYVIRMLYEIIRDVSRRVVIIFFKMIIIIIILYRRSVQVSFKHSFKRCTAVSDIPRRRRTRPLYKTRLTRTSFDPPEDASFRSFTIIKFFNRVAVIILYASAQNTVVTSCTRGQPEIRPR